MSRRAVPRSILLLLILLLPSLLGTASAATAIATADASSASSAAQPAAQGGPDFRTLVFWRATDAASRATTKAAVDAVRALGKTHGFAVEATDDAGRFVDQQLSRFRTVVFVGTAGEVLTDAQEAAFERYFRAGGGFVGIGNAIETEPGWDFLTEVLGTRATGLSDAQRATVKVADRVHPAGEVLPEHWERTDRWYNFAGNVRGVSHVLATVDEGTYTGGSMGVDHPVVWCKDYQGGRSFYTAGGHAASAFGERSFADHLGGGILWAAGVTDGDCGATVLANYEMTVLSAPPNLSEPIGFDVLPDGRVVQTDRRGGVRLHDPSKNTTTLIAQIPVYMASEDGMYGPAVDNDFATNKWVYLFYSPLTMNRDPGDPPYPTSTPTGNAPNTGADPSVWDAWRGYFQLSRFKFVDETAGAPAHLDLDSEQRIMKVEVNRGACCHVAGDIAFDSKNNLWLVTGDDTPAGGGNSGGFGPFNDMRSYEVQTVAVGNATGGTFTLTLDGQTTVPIAFPLVNGDIAAALRALPNVDDVQVTGTGTRTITFLGEQGQQNLPQMTADASGLTSATTATVNVGTPTQGGTYNAPHVDARRGALNTNDLRGKILRISVNEDGTYAIPAGNLFTGNEEGGGKTRPEIYAMGFRNPFRITLDKNDHAYITDYSPDASAPTVNRGPAGTGRMMVVRKPSNYGWPLCYQPDLPFYRWDFNRSVPLDDVPTKHECDNPTRGPANTSRWNTGLTYSPPVARSELWYSFQDNTPPTPRGTPCAAYYTGVLQPDGRYAAAGTCPQLFPELGTGGVGPHGAAKYDYDADNPNPSKFPEYFDEAIFFGEFTRDYLREIRLDAQGNVHKINNVLNCGAAITPSTPFLCDNPMDMKWHDGEFYLLTYGDGFFNINPDAAMVKFSYVKGQRSPIARLTTDRTDGQAPLTVRFSSAGSRDPDPGDSIAFAWDLDGNGTVDSVEPNPTFTYTTNGQYTARLTVTDSSGNSASANTTITVGNTSPTIRFNGPVEGGFFSWGDAIPYSLTVSDPEDGTISCAEVTTSFVLGHDDHGHGEDEAVGCAGVLSSPLEGRDHGGFIFGALSATYTDKGANGQPPLQTTEQIVLNDKLQQPEFAREQSGTGVANTNDSGGGQHRNSLDPGDWIAIRDPANLSGINGVTFRTSGGNAATAGQARFAIELRRGAPDGPLLTTATIPATTGNNAFVSTTAPLTDPGGQHTLYLVFRAVDGGPAGGFGNLNWVRFEGPGVGVTP